jgi:CelD/BcsL family acetyltransferase involved in cellulose biosynthesis
MEHDPDKAKFLSPAMREQMAEIIRWAAHAGILQLSFLKVNEIQAAAYLCFDDADRIRVYNSGFSPGFGYFSPGWVLLGYLIQHAIKTGKSYFDFMRGDEEYKYRFGAEDSFVMKAVIQRQEP